jgi:4-hydroxybenzoate polyprenyltransferase
MHCASASWGCRRPRDHESSPGGVSSGVDLGTAASEDAGRTEPPDQTLRRVMHGDQPRAPPQPTPPLCVDIDGTLVYGDLLLESIVGLLKHRPWTVVLLPFWLLHGKAAFKRRIAERVEIDVSTLPLNEPLCTYLREQKTGGRSIGLFTAADEKLALAVARRVGVFDVVCASDGTTNLVGARKLEAIRGTFGDNFVYVGNHIADESIWAQSRGTIIASRAQRAHGGLCKTVAVERTFVPDPVGLGAWLKALRVHQWAKNLVMFIPAALAAPLLSGPTTAQLLLGFLVFNFIASATYVANDILDLEADRRHHSKRFRPLAAGTIPLLGGLLAVMLLVVVAALLVTLLPSTFMLVAVIYLGTNAAYSFAIKRVALVDTLCLAFLFALRVLAGSMLLAQPAPQWLLLFSMFFFFSLAMVKRYTELLAAANSGSANIEGRGYRTADLPLVLSAGISSAIASMVVFLIYLGGPDVNKRVFVTPEWLWLSATAVAYWLLRIWLLAVRDEMHEDPVLFALRDWVSLLVGGIVALALLLAW